ncbi:MAG: DUF433 domain-containing protein [bacterium]
MAQLMRTEHPYIVRSKNICGGEPVIENTRISVRNIAVMFKSGDTVEDILESYQHLKPSQAYDAISYYLDHQEEVEELISKNTEDYWLNRLDGTPNVLRVKEKRL